MIIKNGPFYVYLHVNKINGKCYAGITRKANVNDRWHNGRGYSYNFHFYSAIKKYGWDNFEHLIFAANLTEEEASNMEKLLIEKFDLTNGEYGYNECNGGYGCRGLKKERNPFYGRVPIKAVEASVQARTGKHLTEEHKRKISCGNKGKPKSAEAIRKTKEAQTGKPRPQTTGAKNGHSKRVICVETQRVYDTITSAANDNGVTIKAICNAIKSGGRSNNLHWSLC